MELFPLEGLDVWRLLAGLGIFLFGMFLLEEGIHVLSGRTFQRLLQRFTNHRLKAVLTGTIATAVLQSSSAVTLMVLAFAGAGVLAMSNAIGVILGANLGTTFTAWIVATVGFKLNIETFAMPFIGIGGLGLIFLGKKPRFAAVSRLLTGFGFLFMGLEYMKVAVSSYTESVGVEQFANLHPALFLVMGFVLTGVTQSSSASLAIILSAVHAGIADLPSAALFVIGANLGTTVTVMLGSLGGPAVKKRVALSHLTFNGITGALALVVLPLLLKFVALWVDPIRDPVTGLALFHTSFNLMGVLVFLPFTETLGRWVTRMYPDKAVKETLFLAKTSPKVGAAGTEALRKEAWFLIHEVLRYHNQILKINVLPDSPIPEIQALPQRPIASSQALYDDLKKISEAMHHYAETLQEESLEESQSEMINRALFAARMALFSAKWLKDLGQDLEDWDRRESENAALRTELQRRQEEAYRQLSELLAVRPASAPAYATLKRSLNRMEKTYEHGLLSVQAGRPHRDAVALAKQLTVNKTWYLAWRNMLLALRELEIGSSGDEAEVA